ncbi:MAG: AAA family ATPase, partial [Planctomycetota bacterium]
VATAFADCCFERRAPRPRERTAVDTATTEKKARDFLRERSERCYPFHPATLSVFQRKWQSLSQYQQTPGTLAMLAQWVARAYREGFTAARTEPLITLGSAPLEGPEFRSVVLGQLGESRLVAAVDADIAGAQAHARALDADSRGSLRHIHRRLATAILFESSGGQTDKVAHLPELRFALGEPGIDTTSIDNAAYALESKGFYIRRIGSDGFRIGHKPKLNKVVNDRRASLDPEGEVRPAIRRMADKEFERGASLPLVRFPTDGTETPDSPRLTLVLADSDWEWGGPQVREKVADWMQRRGRTNRLYPGSLVWCLGKPGRDLREKVELRLAWGRVQREIQEGVLGSEFDRADLAEIRARVSDAEQAAKDEVWAGYRYVVLADKGERDGLKVIDLGAGHASASETLCGRVLSALRSEALLNESVGAGYLERNWPPALGASGAWPLLGLRQAFVNGTLTRLLDPDRTLRAKIPEFVARGEFGLASGQKGDGTFERVWFQEAVPADEVGFDANVFLLKRSRATELKAGGPPTGSSGVVDAGVPPGPGPGPAPPPGPGPEPPAGPGTRTLRLVGPVRPELWNRFGTKILPKLRSGAELRIGVDFSVTVEGNRAEQLAADLRQALQDLGLADDVRIE